MTLTELITAFIAAGPRRMTDADYVGYAGVEGEGFIASLDDGDIIMDVGPEEISYHFEPYEDEELRLIFVTKVETKD